MSDNVFTSHVTKAVHRVNDGRLTLTAELPKPEPDEVEKAADLSALGDDELIAARDLFTTLNDAKGAKAVKNELDSRTSSTAAAEQNPAQWLANRSTPELIDMYRTADAAGASKALKLIKKELDRRGVDPDSEPEVDETEVVAEDPAAAPPLV